MLQKLHSRKFTPSPQINSLSNITYYINDFRCLIILKSIILRKISELYSLANDKASGIRFFQSQQHFYKGRLSRTIATNNPHFFITRKVIIEILCDDKIRRKSFRHIFSLKNFSSDIITFHLQSSCSLLYLLFGNIFQFNKSIFTIPCLMTTRTRHTPHPFQFSSIEIVCFLDIGIHHLYALLLLFQIILIISIVGI